MAVEEGLGHNYVGPPYRPGCTCAVCRSRHPDDVDVAAREIAEGIIGDVDGNMERAIMVAQRVLDLLNNRNKAREHFTFDSVDINWTFERGFIKDGYKYDRDIPRFGGDER